MLNLKPPVLAFAAALACGVATGQPLGVESTNPLSVQEVNRPYVRVQAPGRASAQARVSADEPDLPIGESPKTIAQKMRPAVTPTPTRTASTVAAAPPPHTWEIQLSDGTLSKALIRWSRGSELPVSWEAGKDFPATKATYGGSFLDAVEQVMTDTARSQYPLHACAYDNVLRVLHVSQSCLR